MENSFLHVYQDGFYFFYAILYSVLPLFRIFKLRKLVREIRENPGRLAGEEARGVIVGFLIFPAIGTLAWLGLFFVLGFTNVLGDPSPFFKVFFLASVAILFFIWRGVLKTVRIVTRRVDDEIAKVSRKIRDVIFSEVDVEK